MPEIHQEERRKGGQDGGKEGRMEGGGMEGRRQGTEKQDVRRKRRAKKGRAMVVRDEEIKFKKKEECD